MEGYLQGILKQSKWLWTLAILLLACTPNADAGRNKGGNRLIELLTAGIVAKVLQKQDGDGGGGSEYYPVPVPVSVGGGGGGGGGYGTARHSSHHVTEKIIPIPIPQHTTRIIHINAGQGGDSHQQLNQLLSGGDGGGGSGYSDYGGQQYDGGHGVDQGHESQRVHGHTAKKQSSQSSSATAATIQHLLFTDTGLYGGIPPPPPPPPPASPYLMGAGAHRYYAYRRPMNAYYYDPRMQQAAYIRGSRPVSVYSTQRWPSRYGTGMGYYGKAATSPAVYAAYPPRSSWMSSSPQMVISRMPYRRW